LRKIRSEMNIGGGPQTIRFVEDARNKLLQTHTNQGGTTLWGKEDTTEATVLNAGNHPAESKYLRRGHHEIEQILGREKIAFQNRNSCRSSELRFGAQGAYRRKKGIKPQRGRRS